ncbi:MAG: lamin tail domain-containing protein, partial [Candidatus Jorgensenbacteria bacterium]
FFVIFFAPSHGVFAYNVETHAFLTDVVFDFYNQHSNSNKIPEELKNYLIDGSRREDTTPRYLNHFYDPVYDRGFTKPVLGTWEKSKDWADDSANQNNLKYKVPATIASVLSAFEKGKVSGISSESDFTWRQAIRQWANGEKEKAMFSLGHAIHLIEDMAVPEHTRNDAHGGGSPYENWVGQFNLESPDTTLRGRLVNKASLFSDNLDSIFDKLATYSNNNFYSRDTISSVEYKSINPDYFSLCGDYMCGMINDEDGDYKVFLKKLSLLNNVYSSSDQIFVFLEKIGGDVIISDYWSRLSTKAVQYGAGVIDLFIKEAEAAKNDPNFNKEEPKSFVANVVDAIRNTVSTVQEAVNRTAGFVAGRLGINVDFTPVVSEPAAPISQLTRTVVEELNVLPAEVAYDEPLAVGGLAPSIEASMATGTNEAERLREIQSQLDDIADFMDELTYRVDVATGRTAVNAEATEKSNGVVAGEVNGAALLSSQVGGLVQAVSSGGGGGTTGGSSSAAQAVSVPPPDLVITEIMYDALGADDGREWIEIQNAGTSTASLADVKFFESGVNHRIVFARGSETLAASAFAVIAESTSTFLADYSSFAGNLFDSSFSLSNGGETIALRYGDVTLDEVMYASSTGARGDGNSLQLVENVWRAATPTPGAANAWVSASSSAPAATSTSATATSTEPTATSTEPIATSTEPVATSTEPTATSTASGINHLVISEVQVAGVDAGDEFIELYNPTVAAVDLSGWSLQYAGGSVEAVTSSTVTKKNFTSTSSVAANGFFLVARGMSSSSADRYRGTAVPDMTHRTFSLSGAAAGARIFLVASTTPIASKTDLSIIDVLDYTSTTVPAAGESMERRAWKDNVCTSANGNGEFLGNGCDTGGAADFEIRAVPNPQNTLSFPEPRAAPSTPVGLDASSSIATYGSSSLTMSFAWRPSADYAGATSTVRYELSDASDTASSTLLFGASTSTTFSYRIAEVGRDYTYVLQAFDRDGFGSATTTVTLAVPSFLDNLYFYRDPRASSTSNYLAEFYYSRYPFIPQLWSSGTAWRMAVLYLNREAPEKEYLNIGERWALDPTLLAQMTTVQFKNCADTPNQRDTFLVFPDASSTCQYAGPLHGDISSTVLEDKHVIFTLASSTADVTFASSTDYLTAAFYDLWPYSVPRTFRLVAADATKYYFRGAAPAHAAPVLPASSTVSFDEPNSRIVVRWEAATDPDTLDSVLAYEINFSPGSALDEVRWQSAGSQPSAQIDDQTFISYRFVRTVSPGDAFAIGVRAKDEFGNVSNVATSSWAYPATTIVLAQESANGWSMAWGEKRNDYPDVASIQSISSAESIQFNRVMVRVKESEYHGYGPATLRLSVYGDNGGKPDLNALIGTASLGGVGALTGNSDSTFSFSQTILLSAGVKYWLMLDVAGYASGQGYSYNKWQNAVNVGSDAYAEGQAGKGAAGVCPDPDYCGTTVPYPAGTPDWYFKIST